jgi:ribosomal protein L11 methyltransferase
MREGLQPATATVVMSLETREAEARRLTMLLGEMLDPDTCAVSAFERESDQRWLVEVYFTERPDDATLESLLDLVYGAGQPRPQPSFAVVAEQDWVHNALAGLPAVRAGRFVVHGEHAKDAVQGHEIGIGIEAALAFGTGHHGTTRGCLLHLHDELRRGRPRRVLDVGTGTGVLAIAAARVLHRRVDATDIDQEAVTTAQANSRANAAGAFVQPVKAVGTHHPAIGGHYDLILANILARPLKRLAPELAGLAAPGATLVLSGLLHADVPGVLAVYRGLGFHLAHWLRLDEWSSLRLRRGGNKPRRAAA